MSTTATLDADFSPANRPAPRGTPFAFKLLKPLASLQLTVTLFAFALGLVFLGTLAQKTAGIWSVVDRYFWSWIVLIDLQPTLEFGKIFLQLPKDWKAPSWAVFPFPGGKLIGGLMFINLISAHLYRFRLSWKKLGILVAHSGLVLLFVGEYITREFQVEQRMVIKKHQATNFSEDTRDFELSFTTPDGKGGETMSVIPAWMLAKAAKTQSLISDPSLPVDVRVHSYMVNSSFHEFSREPITEPQTNPATDGLGLLAYVKPKPEVSGVSGDEADLPSAYVTFLEKGTEKPLGTYLASMWFTYNYFERDTQPKQVLTVPEKVNDQVKDLKYDVALRYKRIYKPFSLYLVDFRFDRYIGTNNAKNYSSDLVLIDPERGQERDVHVAMNDPLRHRGETFYQSNFDKDTEATTVLQVVRNPGWFLPYLACGMVGVGLFSHFLLTLITYLMRRRRPEARIKIPTSKKSIEFLMPAGAVLLAGLMLVGMAIPKNYQGNKQLHRFVPMPVVDGGRVKPLDTVARVYLRKISGREEFLASDGKMHPAIEWLMDTLASQNSFGPASKHKVIRIENDQVRALLNLPRREGYRYSLEEIDARRSEMQRAIAMAREQLSRKDAAPTPKDAQIERFFESNDRDVFAGQVIEVGDRIEIVDMLNRRVVPMLLPPKSLPAKKGEDWRSIGQLEQAAMISAAMNRGILPKDLRAVTKDQRAEITQEIIRKMDAESFLKETESMLDAYLWIASRDESQVTPENLETLNKAIQVYLDATAASVTKENLAKVRFEVFMNEFAPTYGVIYVYVLALFSALAGFVLLLFGERYSEAFRRTSFWLLALGFVVHGFALFARMYLQDRTLVFVTNLYSTAVFIGWSAIGMGLIIEKIIPIGVGNLLASVVGVTTAIIAHNLATSRDTLEMMEAVLDTNFWLATHVTTINLGYAATYLAGVAGITYILAGLLTPALTRPIATGPGGKPTELGKVLGQLIYGIVCVATLTSFVGTVLGGIWADQSWGRFWGWDPKENGAILIVIWNAMILHARWCGLIKDRGMAVMTLFGNVITTWSYFGTNQLGVGLHAYGFNNALAFGCVVTWGIHMVLIAVGLIPLRYWRSFAKDRPSSRVT